MNKNNKSIEVDNADKKLHISDVSDSYENRQKEIETCEIKLSKLKSEWRLMTKNDFSYKTKRQEIIDLEKHISDMKQRNEVIKSFLDFQ
jgi:predicted RNase H-like nuclease (RuvC/YqgF family)